MEEDKIGYTDNTSNDNDSNDEITEDEMDKMVEKIENLLKNSIIKNVVDLLKFHLDDDKITFIIDGKKYESEEIAKWILTTKGEWSNDETIFTDFLFGSLITTINICEKFDELVFTKINMIKLLLSNTSSKTFIEKNKAEFILYSNWFSNLMKKVDEFTFIPTIVKITKDFTSGDEKFTSGDEITLKKFYDLKFEDKNQYIEKNYYTTICALLQKCE